MGSFTKEFLEELHEDIVTQFKYHISDSNGVDPFQKINHATISVIEFLTKSSLSENDWIKISELFFTAVSRIDDSLILDEDIITDFEKQLNEEFTNHFPDWEETASSSFGV